MRRDGFTLFEVLVAIVLTAVVALLAYGTAAAGLDTRDRLALYRSTTGSRMIVRSMLTDALRHPAEGGGAAMNDTLFVLVDRSDAYGLPTDEVAFFSRGLTPPLGATATWAMTLTVSDDGLDIRAAPAGESSKVIAHLPGVRGMNVRVLDRTASVSWVDEWDATGRVPAAVSIELFTAIGRPAGPPIVVHGALQPVQ